MSTGDGWIGREAEEERESGGSDRTGLEGSGHSEMGVIGTNAIQWCVCPELRLSMMNVYISSRLGEFGEEVGVRTGGAKGAVIRRAGVAPGQRPRRECGPRGEV